MTRVWSRMASSNDSRQSSLSQISTQNTNAASFICVSSGRSISLPSSTYPLASQTPPALPRSLPPDTDSGYEASPSSATRLTTFQFGGQYQSQQQEQAQLEELSPSGDDEDDEVFLSVDFQQMMLYGEMEQDMGNNNVDDSDEGSINDEEEESEVFPDDNNNNANANSNSNSARSSVSRSSTSGSTGSNGSDRLISSPIPIPSRSLECAASNRSSQRSHLALSFTLSSPSSLPLGERNMIVALGRERTSEDDDHHDRFTRAMFARNWSRYHIGVGAISPHSPPSNTYSHLFGIVAARGVQHGHGLVAHNNNNNHYLSMASQSHQSLSRQSSDSTGNHHPNSINNQEGRGQTTSSSHSSSLSIHSMNSRLLAETRSQANNESQNHEQENGNENVDSRQLPDVVQVQHNSNTVRLRNHHNQIGNGHAHERRSASICLPIDQDTVRSIGLGLRRISEEFVHSSVSRRETLSQSEPSNNSHSRLSVIQNIFASVRLSRRSLSSRLRSHHNHNHIHTNGRPRSFSTNDADAADVEE